MTAFAAALQAIYRDPNMAVDALYRAGGDGPVGTGVPMRVMREAPDEDANWNGGQFVRDSARINVLVASCPDLDTGDRFEIAGVIYVIEGDPSLDADRLEWRAVARAL